MGNSKFVPLIVREEKDCRGDIIGALLVLEMPLKVELAFDDFRIWNSKGGKEPPFSACTLSASTLLKLK